MIPRIIGFIFTTVGFSIWIIGRINKKMQQKKDVKNIYNAKLIVGTVTDIIEDFDWNRIKVKFKDPVYGLKEITLYSENPYVIGDLVFIRRETFSQNEKPAYELVEKEKEQKPFLSSSLIIIGIFLIGIA